jgi:hypothetical protein
MSKTESRNMEQFITSPDSNHGNPEDINNLNLELLDVEELEHRIELADMADILSPAGCYYHGSS